MEAVDEFERKYSREEEEEARRQEIEEDRKTFSREIPGRYTAKMLYGWGDKKYEREYWRRLEENWRRWKQNPFAKVSRNPFLWIKELEEGKMGNIKDMENEL